MSGAICGAQPTKPINALQPTTPTKPATAMSAARMPTVTAADVESLAQEVIQRAAFVKAQVSVGIDSAQLMSAQVVAICSRLSAWKQLPVTDATRLTESISAGPWSAEQKSTLAAAIGEATVRMSAPTGTRRLQHAPSIDRFFTAGDKEALTVNVVCRRAWLVGITCPSEKLSVRLAAIVAAVGMNGDQLSPSSRLSLLVDVKSCLKQMDKDKRHPFPHLPALPASPSDLGPDRLAFAYGSADQVVAGLGDASSAAVDMAVLLSPARKTHATLRAAPPTQVVVQQPAQTGASLQTQTPGQMPAAMQDAFASMMAFFAHAGGAVPAAAAPNPAMGLRLMRPRALGPAPAESATDGAAWAGIAPQLEDSPSMSEGSLAAAERTPPPTPTSPPEPLRPASTPVASPPKPEDDGPATVAEMEREQLQVAAAKKKGTATGKDSAGGKAKGKAKAASKTKAVIKTAGKATGKANIQGEAKANTKAKSKVTARAATALFLGCGKCRGSPSGCVQCRNPAFNGARWRR